MAQIADYDSIMARLRAIGEQPDESINLGQSALYLAALEQPGIALDRYEHHIAALADTVRERFDSLVQAGAGDVIETRLAALKHGIADQHQYTGDKDNYDDLQNASLIRVIDRRKGLPITLAILYVQVGRLLGWDVYGLNLPGHFICRLDMGPQRILFDPFNDCAILQAPELRQLVKKAIGPQAELSASYYEPADNRATLIRLQNNIKFRRIEAEDYEGALQTVQAMRAIDPNEYRLLLDEGVLCARTSRPREAVDALENYIRQAPADHDRREAGVLLDQIRDSLN